jgi:hypothetical protein
VSIAHPPSPVLSILSSILLLRNDVGFLMVGTYTEGRRLEGCAQQSLLVVEIGPLVLTTGVAELARGQKTSRLSLSHVCCTVALVLESLEGSWCGGAESCEILVGVEELATVGVVREVAGIRNARMMVV